MVMGKLSALDPGKQGLKRVRMDHCVQREGLSALDPGKQGLKQVVSEKARKHDETFSA